MSYDATLNSVSQYNELSFRASYIYVQIRMLKELLSWVILRDILSYSGGSAREFSYRGAPWLPSVQNIYACLLTPPRPLPY